MKKVSVIIPCYNEQEGIGKVIRDIPKKFLKKLDFEIEVIVVNNNSTDLTSSVINNFNVKRLYEKKTGKGYAMRSGFNAISPDTRYVIMMDGDHTYKPKEMLRMIEPLASNFCDVVIGSRLGGKLKKNSFQFKNRLANWFFTFLVRVFYHGNVTDVLTGYFAWKREVIDNMKNEIESTGFAIEMEMITKMIKMGYQIYSVPITYDKRKGISKLNPWMDGLRILLMLIKNISWQPKPYKNVHRQI